MFFEIVAEINKKEGDKYTPLAPHTFGKLYYRADRVKKPISNIETKIIKRDMGWCDDVSIHFT